MPSTRLKGNVTPVFTLSNLTGSPSSINPGEDLVSVRLAEGDTESVTFGDFASGTRSFKFEIEAVYSGDSGSLYDVLWTNSGKTGVTFVYGPHGNSTASAGKPVFTGTCTLPPKPELSTEASASDPATFEVEIEIDSITRTTA
jgi:hypothetical protein